MPESNQAHMDQGLFRKLLFRNIALPLSVGLVTSIAFASLIFYMLGELRQVDHSDRVISDVNNTVRLFVDAETGLRGYVITGREGFLEPYQEALKVLPGELEELRGFVADSPVQVNRINIIKIRYDRWIDYAESVRELREKNRLRAIDAVTLGRGKQIMDEIRDQFNLFMQTEQNLRDSRSQSANDSVRLILSLVIGIGLLSGILVATMGRRQMKLLAESYEESLERQHQQNEILTQQQWLRTGEAELAARTAGDRDIEELGELVLGYLTEYVGASIGALYVENEQKVFERRSTYAFKENEKFNRSFALGSGVLGQVARDQKTKILEELPPDYLRVNSALGDMPPRQIAIVPMKSEKDTNAVLELGFLQPIEPRVIELLEQTAETIYMSVRASLYRDKLRRLLNEVQTQAEELQTQQEELRTSNEELEVQTHMLKEAQSRLEAQHAEMEQTNAQLEEQTQMLEQQKDVLNKSNRELEDAQEALNQRALDLQHASQYKSEFLANMSHELRTPLNSSLILAKLLADNKEGNLSEQQIQFAQQIETSGNDLLALINDILDLSKVESGKLEIVVDNVDIEHLVGSLKNVFAPIALEKKVEFKTEIAPGTPVRLRSDLQRIEQILRNLLSNAFKFTSEGQVTLSVRPGEQAGEIEFNVSDTGIGIPNDKHEVIFEAFRQADGTTNRRFGGTGLGLSISRDLSHLLGGSLKLTSEVDKGSTFTLTLPENYEPRSIGNQTAPTPNVSKVKAEAPKPMAARTEKSAPASTKIPLGPARDPFFADDRQSLQPGDRVVLIVEDDITAVRYLFDVAHEQKFKCLVAETAEDAIHLAQMNVPQAVLLDMKLPDHNGLVVLDQLKQSPRTRHIPVHVISAQDFSRQALEMGAIGYIQKPAKKDQLVDVFAQLENKIHQRIRKVLIIEDDKVQREAIQRLIAGTQVETQAVALGKEALDLLKKDSFDCMIMDLILPDMSGFELLDKMTEEDDHSYPPVIIYTARELTREEEDKLRTHSQSVIIKGARSPERLLDEVTLFLHKVESQLAPEQQKALSHLRSREKIFDGKSILIVDDDMRNVFALTAALEQKGAKVLIARNGEEALRRLSASTTDLVLMDIMMPVMDGYKAMREIRKNPDWAKLPIIALTAKAMKDDRELCLSAGANDYLSKPVDLEKLLSLIRVWISLQGRA